LTILTILYNSDRFDVSTRGGGGKIKTRVIVSAILLPVFLAVLVIFPPYVLTVVISVICGIAAYELLHATGGANKRTLVYTIIAAALVPAVLYLFSQPLVTPNNTRLILALFAFVASILFIIMCLLIIEIVLRFKTEKQITFLQILAILCAGIVIPYLLSSLISLRTMPLGPMLVMLPIVSAFLTDSGAYFVGMAMGKRKVFPNISPNKTVEGFIGGLIIGTAGMVIYGVILAFITPFTIVIAAFILYGVVGAVVTEFGDLAFSFIKRKCGVKDYGKLIPGHGGVLDRFDSMIFNAPVMYLLVLTVPAIAIS